MDFNPLRVLKILERLGMTTTIGMTKDHLARHPRQPLGLPTPKYLDHLGERKFTVPAKVPDELDEFWMKRMTSTELQLIHLARALIMNPEVMVLQRPLLKFDKVMEATV